MSECRDLLTEFSLLKHVSHQNVIKLLGICSRDGSFLHFDTMRFLPAKASVFTTYIHCICLIDVGV